MPAGAFTAGKSLQIPDDYLSSHATVSISDLTKAEFTSRGFYVFASSDETEEAAGYASIDGVLVGEPDTARRVRRLSVRQPIGYAFKKIWAENTTGTSMEFLGEV